METWIETMIFLQVILPRELVSDGVLEYKIPSSTIWNRCSWVGTDFRNDVRVPVCALGWQKDCGLVALFAFTFFTSHSRFVMHSGSWSQEYQWNTSTDDDNRLCSSSDSSCWSPAFWTPDPPLTKADRFPLVFRVSIMSSTIWNRLQCGGTINKHSASATWWNSSNYQKMAAPHYQQHSNVRRPS